MQLPAGTVTFLLTDIEGSTRKWEEKPAAMRVALDRHNEIFGETIAQHDGVVIQERGEGDSIFAVFQSAHDAIAAAAEVQRRLEREPWPDGLEIRVRMGMNTGEGDLRDGHYRGSASINPCARLRAVAHGGQVLVSGTTAQLARPHLPAEIQLRDLGEYRLRDIAQPMRVFQLVHPDLPSDFPALKTVDHVPNNLPVQVTSFVGREQELATVRDLLRHSRVVTLVGVGGVGKTRLALAVAADSLPEFEDGVFFVELAPLTDPDLTVAAVATAIGVHEQPDRTYEAAVIEHLAPLKRLLVLDNCEHLVERCAVLVDRLIHACPDVRVVATSRESLGIAGEAAWRVPSLPVAQGEEDDPEVAQRAEAIRLFVERATAVESSFRLTRENVPAVIQLCRRLDGIPLAIELAAARVRVMSPEQMLARIEDRFRLLTGGGRAAMERQQTLRAAIDWSYALLSEPEKTLFKRLSLFSGGFDLPAVEAVCCDAELPEYDAIDLLERLVDKSLVVPMQAVSRRFNVLETLRQYAREKLLESEETNALRRRHAAYFLRLAEATPRSGGDILETDLDNFRSAIEWALDADPATSLRLATALAWFFTASGRVREGASRLEQALDRVPQRDHARAAGLFELGWFKFWEGETRSPHIPEEAVSIARELRDRRLLWESLHLLGSVLADSRAGAVQNERAFGALEESLALAREAGDLSGESSALHALGMHSLMDNDLPGARHYVDQSAELKKRLGDPVEIAWADNLRALVAYRQGDYRIAVEAFQHAGGTFARLEHTPGLALVVDVIAAVAMTAGLREEALRLHAAVVTFGGMSGVGARETERLGFAWDPNLERQRDEASQQADEEGARMSLAEAFAYAQQAVLARLLERASSQSGAEAR